MDTKKYSITVYLGDGEKDNSHLMTFDEVSNWIKKHGKGKVYMVWDFEANQEVTSKFK